VIDYGLLISIIIAFGLPSLVVYWWVLTIDRESVGFTDVVLAPALAGLVVGRLVTLALDDPNSIGSVADMIIIRSGVEFWPGVAAAVGLLVWSAWRAGRPVLALLAGLLPLAMVGYAGYEAACLFRDGCFGPESAVGLRPPGLSTTMLPVGLFVAGAVAVGAFAVRALAIRGQRPVVIVLTAALVVASVRAVGAIWMPHVGEGLTRQHETSIGVAVAAMLGLVIAIAVSARREDDVPMSDADADADADGTVGRHAPEATAPKRGSRNSPT
jgi:hypothetical protein